MKLHRNAALSWSGRRLLAVRVDGWTLTGCGGRGRGQRSLCAEVGWQVPVGRRSRPSLIAPSAPRRVANRTPAERVAVVLGLRRLRMTAAEIAETLAMPLSTVSAVLRRSGIGRLGRIGLEPAVRYERERPGSSSTSTSKSSGGSPDPAIASPAASPAAATTAAPTTRAGSTSTSPSTTTAASPTPRCSPTRKRSPPPASSAERSATTTGTATQVERILTDNGSCYRATVHACLPPTRHPPPSKPPLPATNKRQSRTLHPHPHQRLGPRSHLPQQPRTQPRP